ncbi:MAG: hypothetical protein EBR30_13425 [Cytophagia bacterium]|nr:hypothetical protein [Cytophagia bacterium]
MSLVKLATAQSFVDNALLFSRTPAPGSARIQALGGAQAALGGDYSSALSNPAGLGMYNRSELTFSLGNYSNATDVNYGGSQTSDSRNRFSIPGFSYVQRQSHSKGKYLGGAFAFTFSRTNNLNTKFAYGGDYTESSLIDYLIDFTNSNSSFTPDNLLNGDEFYTLGGLGYGSYLLQDFEENGSIFYGSPLSPLQGETRTIQQREEVSRRGSQSQLSFSYGGNYDDVLFFGATLGISTIRFTQDQLYTESNFRFSDDPTYNPLSSFQLDENFDIQGSGVNFTVGAIYRPVDFVQVGLSYVTPTVYDISDAYSARIDARWNNFDYYNDGQTILNNAFAEFDVPVISEYTLNTPGKLTAGAAFMQEFGFITADVEYVNYGNAKYSSNVQGESYDADNNVISDLYRDVVNVRVGAEFREDIFRLRLGYSLQPDPYRFNSSINRSIQTISGGVGIRQEKFFIDLAFVQAHTEGRRIPYTVPGLPSPEASLKIKNTTIMATVGFPF